MKMRSAWASVLLLVGAATAGAQNAPDVVWEMPTPGLGDNSVTAVGWSPLGDNVAVGSTDRWFRVRRARDGLLGYSVLEPQHSHGPGQIAYSIDAGLVGVRNRAFGMSFRVQRTSDGAALGNVIATLGTDGLLTFAPDATLLANTGGDGTISRWRFSDFTFFRVTGSGYQTVTSAFNFSPDGSFQTVAGEGGISVRRRSDGAVIRRLAGGSTVVFSPDSSLLAAWSPTPTNQIVVWRTSDWTVVQTLVSGNPQEGVAALRFTPDSARLVATGYEPFLVNGLWQQKGFIRFWRMSDGAMQWNFDQGTDIAVTSAVAWSPGGNRFVYGLYDGSVAVAQTPP
jgi:WD40 repeat protein